MNSFFDDLSRGKIIEEKVLSSIQKKYPCATIIDGFKGYDIWIPELHQSVEVKYDPMSCNTGNIVVEIEMFGKPSALFTTKADWWVFFDDYIFAWYKPMQIIQYIMANNKQWTEFVGEGDTAPKKAYLLKKSEFFKASTILRNKYGETIKNER